MAKDPDAGQFAVLREEGTESPFTSPLNNEKRKGTFVCAGCDLPLFDSKTKFESGTGWPSFYDVIPGRVETRPITSSSWRAPSTTARAAAAIKATYSTTARSPRACATATTASR
jgi:peptide methionine sulfoxide reductase MsrB